VARDPVVRFRVDDTDAVSHLARLDAALARFERSEPQRVIRSTAMAFEHMAASAIGVEGPLGRVASTLLMFGTGGAVGIAILGGLAAISLAMKVMAEDAKKAAQETKKLTDELTKLSPHGVVEAARIQISPLQIEASRIQAELDARARFRAQFGPLGALIPDFDDGKRKRLAELNKQIADITNTQILPAERAWTEELRKREEIAERERQRRLKALRDQAVIDAELAGFRGQGLGGVQPFGLDIGAFFAGLPSRPAPSGAAFNRPTTFGASGGGPRFQIPGFGAMTGADTSIALAGHPPVPPEVIGAIKDTQQRLLVSIIGSVTNVIAALAAGGGPGAALAGIGAGISLVPGGQIAGAVLGGLGAIISAFGKSKDAQPVMIMGYSTYALTQEEQVMLATLGVKGVRIGLIGTQSQADAVIPELARSSRLGPGGIRLPVGGR
jgi:hypothetical protein